MNRPVKFRVWDLSAKLFRHFLYVNIVEWAVSGDDKSNYVFQQYTGLKDKNGKEIYEGDVIRGQFDFGPAGYVEKTLPIHWHNECGYQWNYWNLSTIEVIGNIFENQNLLLKQNAQRI